MDDEIRLVKFDFNPFAVLQSLSKGKLSETNATLGDHEIEITPAIYG